MPKEDRWWRGSRDGTLTSKYDKNAFIYYSFPPSFDSTQFNLNRFDSIHGTASEIAGDTFLLRNAPSAVGRATLPSGWLVFSCRRDISVSRRGRKRAVNGGTDDFGMVFPLLSLAPIRFFLSRWSVC